MNPTITEVDQAIAYLGDEIDELTMHGRIAAWEQEPEADGLLVPYSSYVEKYEECEGLRERARTAEHLCESYRLCAWWAVIFVVVVGSIAWAVLR